LQALDILMDQFGEIELLPLALAVLLGGAIGLEREIHGRPAGLRTHIMVCLSTTIAIMASRHAPGIFASDPLVPSVVVDPNRLGAGILTGIGFLGAAAVIRSGDIVRGITTGACVWAAAVLGIVIGSGHYALAVLGTILMLVVLVAFDTFFRWVSPVVYRRLIIRGTTHELPSLQRAVRELLQERRIRLQNVSGRVTSDDGTFVLEMHVRCRNSLQGCELLEDALRLDGVRHADWTLLSD